MREDPRPKTFEEKLEAYKTAAFNTFRNKPITHWILLAMVVAFPASSLLSRVYFSDGGKGKWIISWVAVAGWPIPLLVLIPMYFVLGFLSAADNLMYANGYAYLPASTASLLGSTSLIFSTLFGYFTVKNKIINSIVVVTAAMVIIALGGVWLSLFSSAYKHKVLISCLRSL